MRLYRVGAARRLLGAPVSSLDPGGTAREAFAAIEDPSAWDDVELESRYLPTYVRARIHGLPARSRPLVIVNGVVAAVGDPVRGSATEVAYTVMIPPALLRGGTNALRIGALEGDGRLIEVTNR